MNLSFESSLGAEVEEQPNLDFRAAQVVQELVSVRLDEKLSGLHFHNHALGDQEVDSEVPYV